MRYAFVLFAAMIVGGSAYGGTVTIKKDTIMANGRPYALLVKNDDRPAGYCIWSFTGDCLIEMHNSRIEQKGKPMWILSFPHDKQAMMPKRRGVPLGVLAELVKYGVIKDGKELDDKGVRNFIFYH